MVTENSNNLSEIQAQWVTVRSKIRRKIGDAQFASWIKLLTLDMEPLLYMSMEAYPSEEPINSYLAAGDCRHSW